MNNLRPSSGSAFSRYAILACIALTSLVIASSVWNLNQLKDHAKYLATEEARANWNKDQAFRRWATRHGGLYVRPDERTPPNPYLEHLPNRDVETTDGMKLTLMNPAYMMSQMTKEFESMYGIKGKITGQILLNPKNKADPWELNALKQFDKGAKEVVEQANIGGQPYLRLMRPMVMRKGCVLCHGHLGFKVGDIRGGVSISIPMASYLGANRDGKILILSTHGTVWSVGMLAIGFVSWRGQKRETVRRQAEEALRESEGRFKDIAETSSDRFWEMDENFLFTLSTDNTDDEFPIAGDYLIGRTRWDAVGVDPEKDEKWRRHRDDHLAHRPYRNFEFAHTNEEGQTHHLSVSGTPFFDDAGVFKGYRGSVSGITERKQAEEAALESQARLSGILNIAPEAVIAIGDDMNIRLFNQSAERIFGYRADEVLWQPLEILMPEYLREGHRKYVEAFDSSGDTHRLMDRRQEIVGLRKDGSKFPASASVSKLEIGGEKIFTVMMQDVTERKHTKDALSAAKTEAETANRAKSEFLAAMSHDLRTPLNAILGFADIISQQYFGPVEEKYQEYANDIQSSGEHLLMLVNEILDLSSIEAGRQSLVKENLSTEEIIRECVKIVGEKANSGGINLVTEIPKDLPPIYADRRASKQILLNLLTNAVKFTPEGGRVTVSAKALKQATTLKIADTGKGISPEELPKLTDPFIRADADPYLAEQGWGLGLSISKSLIELHDGEMDIKSKVGKGTTVTVTFPNETT